MDKFKTEAMEAKITWVEIIGRVLLFIPVVTIITYSAVKHWGIMVYNFVVYGGETAIYNDKMNRKTIVDVFSAVSQLKQGEYIFTSIEGNQQMITKQSATLQADGWELAGQISTVLSDNGNRMVIPFKKRI